MMAKPPKDKNEKMIMQNRPRGTGSSKRNRRTNVVENQINGVKMVNEMFNDADLYFLKITYRVKNEINMCIFN
jgi:hypothetical protein